MNEEVEKEVSGCMSALLGAATHAEGEKMLAVIRNSAKDGGWGSFSTAVASDCASIACTISGEQGKCPLTTVAALSESSMGLGVATSVVVAARGVPRAAPSS